GLKVGVATVVADLPRIGVQTMVKTIRRWNSEEWTRDWLFISRPFCIKHVQFGEAISKAHFRKARPAIKAGYFSALNSVRHFSRLLPARAKPMARFGRHRSSRKHEADRGTESVSTQAGRCSGYG
ncbi:MAG: hypothetical protein ABR907_12015, partial [Terracidiphilus sp.]